MFFFLSKTLDVFLSPLTWGMLLALAGVWRRYRRLRWAPAASVAVLYVFSIEPTSNALERHLERRATESMRKDVTYDAVLLLGGIVDHAATAGRAWPSYSGSVERLLVSYELLRSGRARSVVVSGATSWAGDPVNEARTLARQLERWGIARERIVVEDRARNTRDNAIYCKAIAAKRGFRRLLVVTSAFHMRRALGAFRAVSLEVDALPVDYRSYEDKASVSYLPRAGSLDASTMALREIFGSWVYSMMGYAESG
jgi:uncharacterized SAM-binding protein YcdF (DUF218 family)